MNKVMYKLDTFESKEEILKVFKYAHSNFDLMIQSGICLLLKQSIVRLYDFSEYRSTLDKYDDVDAKLDRYMFLNIIDESFLPYMLPYKPADAYIKNYWWDHIPKYNKIRKQILAQIINDLQSNEKK